MGPATLTEQPPPPYDSLAKTNYLVEHIATEMGRGQTLRRNWYQKREIEDLLRSSLLNGDGDFIRYVIKEYHLDPNSRIRSNPTLNKKYPLIYFAAKKGHLEMVKLLVAMGANIQPVSPHFDDGDETAIMTSIKRGQYKIVKYLLRLGANANGTFCGAIPHTFLGKAALKKQMNVANLLIVYHASIENALRSLVSRFLTDVHACEKSEIYQQAIKNLLDFAVGADFTDVSFLLPFDISGFNFFGISVNGLPVSQKLLESLGFRGANKAIISPQDLENTFGMQRYIINNKRKQIAARRVLFVYAPDREVDLTTLKQTINKGALEMARARIDHKIKREEELRRGKDLNRYAEYEGGMKYTILHLAILRGSLEIVQLLLRRGLNPTLPAYRDKDPISSIQLAQLKGHPHIANYLKSLTKQPAIETLDL